MDFNSKTYNKRLLLVQYSVLNLIPTKAKMRIWFNRQIESLIVFYNFLANGHWYEVMNAPKFIELRATPTFYVNFISYGSRLDSTYTLSNFPWTLIGFSWFELRIFLTIVAFYFILGIEYRDSVYSLSLV